MPRFGCHVSVAGGVSLAVERARYTGCDAFQVFTRNASQWAPKALDPAEVRAFRERLDASGLGPVVSHGSYLVNLASTDAALRARSSEAFGDELDRAEALGLDGVVLHPGARGTATEAAALERVARALGTLLRARRQGRTLVLLENTAGQGTTLGHRFEQLARIVELLDGSPRVGLCIDTCHLLAAGYDISTPGGYRETFAALDRLLGADRVRAFHVNDSKAPCGARVDRHAHVGQGHVGLDGFRRLVNDRRFAALPMLLETPKQHARGTTPAEPDACDRHNLSVLRSLVRKRGSAAGLPRRKPPVRSRLGRGTVGREPADEPDRA